VGRKSTDAIGGRRLLLSASAANEVGACSNQAGLRLNPAQCLQQAFPQNGVVQPGVEILLCPNRSFDSNQVLETKARGFNFRADLIRSVEIRSRKPFRSARRVLMDSLRQITRYDCSECLILQASPPDASAH